MKKLLAVAVVAMFSINCMAGTHSRTISINNNSDKAIKVRDKDNHTVSVDPGESTSLAITVHEPHGSFPIPSSIMPHKTTITVEDDEDHSNSIEVDEHTKVVNVEKGLKLGKK